MMRVAVNDAVRERSGPGAADSLLMTAFVCHVGAHLEGEDSGRLDISLVGVSVHPFRSSATRGDGG